MTSSKMGLFSLIDPPSPDHEAVVREAYKTTDFPWHRIIPRMRRWPHESIKVVWQPSISSGAIGTYANGVITLSNQFGLSGQDFTFVHECGHMIDSLSFTYEVQQELMEIGRASCRERV